LFLLRTDFPALKALARGLLLASFLLLPDGTASAAERVALILGNGAYRNAPTLPNAPADAKAIAQVLRRLGFEVLDGIDFDRAATDALIHRFARELDDARVALFFYSGHGMQVAGENYLVPVDAKLEHEADLDFETIPLRRIMSQLERSDRTSVVFLDACRDNPFLRRVASRSTRTRGGLAPLQGGVGTLIAYATAPDTVAMDGTGNHSPFTASLLTHIETPGLEVGQLLKKVRADVIAATNKAQVPWDHSSLVGDFYFVPPPAAAESAGVPAPPGAATTDEQRFWDAAQSLQGPERKIPALVTYLASYPSGAFATLAKLQLDDLKEQQAASKVVAAVDPQVEAANASRTGQSAAVPSATPEPEPLSPEEVAERDLQLNRAKRRQIQRWLSDLGLETKGADGNFGQNTRGAILAFQRRNGLVATGYLDSVSLARLRDAAAEVAAMRPQPEPRPTNVVEPAPAPALSAKTQMAPSTQVLCRAPNDPAWMEPRLIMLFQCNRLGGQWTLP
jgi:uncharacterized caspase-like protein